MFKKDNRVLLLSVIPFDIYNSLQTKLGIDLSDCKGVVEKESDREIWFGFVNRKPMRFTYRSSDQKTTWAPCNIQMVKTKIHSLEN